MNTQGKHPVNVLYNSACPVCDAGIRREKKRTYNCNINWLDIHTQSRVLEETGLDLESVRQKLHVIDTRGNLKIGIDAFISLWSASPAQAWKARLFSIPGIHAASTLAYNAFAWALYKYNRVLDHW